MAVVPTSLIAFALLLSFLPGIAFFAGFYTNEKMSRDVVAFTSPAVVSGIIMVAVLVQTLLLLTFVLPSCGDSAGTDGPLCSIVLQGTATEPTAVTTAQVVHFNLILLVVSAFMFILGAAYIHFCSKRPSLFIFASSWSKQYLFFDGFCLVHVMTELPNASGPVIYRGFLDDLYLKADGTIATIHLRKPVAIPMKQYRSGEFGSVAKAHRGSLENHDIVIDGSQIKNIALRNLVNFAV
ncbi:MAG: hypothetical protein AAGI92_04765 [Pseudomonadota bacterium]